MTPTAVKQLFLWANKAKGTLNIPVVEEALHHIGWRLDHVAVAVPIREDGFFISNDPFKSIIQNFGGITWGYSGVHEPKYFFFNSFDEANTALKALRQYVGWHERDEVLIGHVYVPNPGDVVVHGNYGGGGRFAGMAYFAFTDCWVGLPGYTVTSFNGRILSFPRDVFGWNGKIEPVDESRVKAPSFYTFAYKYGLDEAAQEALDVLGEEEVTGATRSKAAALRMSLPTCPVCVRGIETANDGKIMRHGWQVAR